MSEAFAWAAATAFDVVLDLSGPSPDREKLPDRLERFRSRSGLVTADRRIWVAAEREEEPCAEPFLRPRATGGGVLAAALREAAAKRRGLLIATGAWRPANEVAIALSTLVDADPMVGVVQPRFAGPDGLIAPFPHRHSPAILRLRRAALPFLPETVFTPELSAPLMLITPQAALLVEADANLAFDQALQRLLTRLRRLGFRTLVSNRIVAEHEGAQSLTYSQPLEEERDPLWSEQAKRARTRLADSPMRKLETLLAPAFLPEGKARVLLDCRNAQPAHNGTSHAMLGYLEGLESLAAPGFDFSILASARAAQFHEFSRRFPSMTILLDEDAHRKAFGYLAAVRLDQPYKGEDIRFLYKRALFCVFTILDTISWDIVADGTPNPDAVWRALPILADGLAFNSAYSRDRFAARFGPVGIPQVVTLHSLDPAEVAPPVKAPTEESDAYILVFGNKYEHKLVDPTVACLSDAFPYQTIVVLGGTIAPTPRVRLLGSGLVDIDALNALVAQAAVLVFPSCYEGFGLPVVHGLGHGRVVAVRRSALWEELVCVAELPGRLVPFDSDIELVTLVGETLQGRPPDGLRMGQGAPHIRTRWRDCAGRLVDLLRTIIAGRDGQTWITRQALFEVSGDLSP